MTATQLLISILSTLKTTRNRLAMRDMPDFEVRAQIERIEDNLQEFMHSEDSPLVSLVKAYERLQRVQRYLYQATYAKRMVDGSPDTSWLGEYGNSAESDYAIDRAHSTDCNSVIYSREGGNTLDHVSAYIDACLSKETNEQEAESLREVSDILWRIAG